MLDDSSQVNCEECEFHNINGCDCPVRRHCVLAGRVKKTIHPVAAMLIETIELAREYNIDPECFQRMVHDVVYTICNDTKSRSTEISGGH